MKGMNLNVNRRFVTGQFQQGRDVDRSRPDRLGLFVATPRTLALFNHTQQNHLSTGVTLPQFAELVHRNNQQNPNFTNTHKTRAENILRTAGVDFQNLSTANKVKAAIMLGKDQVSAAWMRANIGDVVGGNQRVIDAGKMLHKAYSFAHNQQMGGLQDPSASFNTRLALDVSEKILAQNGTVDQAMVAVMIDQLENDTLAGTFQVGPHRQEMLKLLRHINTNVAFRNALSGISAPNNGDPQTKTLRATINKPVGNLTDRDVRKAVLSSMLSHLRQGSVGSCFGTSIAIHLKTNHYNKTLTMLKDLVENNRMQGTFQRNVNSNPVQFSLPGNHNTLDLQFNHKMKFDKSGNVTKVNNQNLPQTVKLYDIPGIIQGLKAVGITNRQTQIRLVTEAADRMAGTFFDAKKSPKELLANIIDNQGGLGPKSAAKKKAAFAFHATMENRLMRTFEYTLSGFAETRHAQTLGSKLSTQIDNLYMTVNYGEQNTPWGQHVAQKMLAVNVNDQVDYGGLLGGLNGRISSTLNEAFTYKYNPELVHGQLSDDGHSSHGGFTITFTHPTTQEESVITTPDELATAVKAIFVHVATQDIATIENGNWTDKNLVTSTHATLMREIFEKVDTEQLGANLIARTDKLQGNPVGFTQGADPAKVVRMLFPNTSAVHTTKLDQSENNTGKTVLNHVITTLKAMQTKVSNEDNNYSVDTLRNMSIPMSTDTHAFLLKPGLSPFLLQQMDREEDDINDSIDTQTKPQQLTEFADTALNRQEVLGFVDRFAGAFGMNKNAVKQALRNQQHSLKPNDIYQSMVAGLPDDNKKAGRADQIAFYLAKTFNAPTREVIFADTNWGNGDKDIHFGVVFNPFSDKHELWSFEYNGQDYTARNSPDQKKFVQGNWTIFDEPHNFGF
ncbi:hypothetical protein [Acanthopleuribacter pedis]|uniref:Uncharacterized protein n=1 Tax=Acanthopleuribacter pedis TaxID=442870 RepID=A0A8J7QCW2_9BACT|nr:hypothetical protein [Acanthopleuribacter pedis]MBO1321454.1 hypothetical protein [Acanthopleuribacter pedis]